MVLITNFGDTVTSGNATINQVLTVIGELTAVNGVLAGSTTATIGNISSPFQTVFATTLTATQLNTSNIFGTDGFVGIGTTDPSGTSLYVMGNIFSNTSLTTINIFSNTLTASNITVANIYSNNINVQGNVYVSNNIVTANLVVTTLYYGEDLTKQGPYLTPSPTNSTIIQAWISAACNASSQPTSSWWATSPNPVFGLVASGPQGGTDYAGSVLLPDGRVVFVPCNASNIGVFNPTTSTFTAVQPPSLIATDGQFAGGVLAPNGNVIFIPSAGSSVGVFNPINQQFSLVTAETGFSGGVVAPTGTVILVPNGSASIGAFNPYTLEYASTGVAATGYKGGVLLPSGNVIFSPNGTNLGIFNLTELTTVETSFSATQGVLAPNGNVVFFSSSDSIGSFNPENSAFSTFTGGSGSTGGGVLLPSGNILYNGTSSVVMVNPVTLTASLAVSDITGTYNGASLLPNGQVVLCPSTATRVGLVSTMAPVDPAFCLSPYFNKY